MKQLKVVLTILIVLCLTSHAFAYPKNVLYQDETYSIYQQGYKVWLAIGTPSKTPVFYTPVGNGLWRKRSLTTEGSFDEDIFFKKLPFPFGLLLASDMVYINKIIYYPDSKASITYFNGPPFEFLRALLKKIKNV
jgi:hypothetical protein